MRTMLPTFAATGLVLSALAVGACTPTVRVEVPDKPIEVNLNINMNLKIEGDVRFRLEEAAEAIEARPDLF